MSCTMALRMLYGIASKLPARLYCSEIEASRYMRRLSGSNHGGSSTCIVRLHKREAHIADCNTFGSSVTMGCSSLRQPSVILRASWRRLMPSLRTVVLRVREVTLSRTVINSSICTGSRQFRWIASSRYWTCCRSLLQRPSSDNAR